MSIFKRAYDLSFVVPKASGAFGNYYSNFNTEQQEKLKKQIGNVDQNTGLKHFRYDKDIIENLAEIISLHFIVPYINKIGIKTTFSSAPLSISNYMNNKTVILQHLNGKYLDFLPQFIRSDLGSEICNIIYQKLKTIGVMWSDCHSKNFLFDDVLYKEILDAWNNLDCDEDDHGYTNYAEHMKTVDSIMEVINRHQDDLFSHIMIVDMGLFSCSDTSEPGMAILDWFDSIKNKYPKRYLSFISLSVSRVVG